jgi:hypothetical protein
LILACLTVVSAPHPSSLRYNRHMVTLNQVIGTWKVTEDPFNSGEDTVYKFFPFGDLTLSFESRKRKQYIFLRFNLECDTIITDQPSAPKIERARIAVDGNEMTLD